MNLFEFPPPGGPPLTALAPMQDVTDLAFMRVIAHYGAPDLFFTEFFRVHAQSRPEKHILRSITENRTGRPVFASTALISTRICAVQETGIEASRRKRIEGRITSHRLPNRISAPLFRV